MRSSYVRKLLPAIECGGGFRGSPCDGPMQCFSKAHAQCGHLTMTYTALLLLAILRDDFSRLNRAGIASHVSSLQNSDGR